VFIYDIWNIAILIAFSVSELFRIFPQFCRVEATFVYLKVSDFNFIVFKEQDGVMPIFWSLLRLCILIRD
jgi:hypothetical protein